MTVAYYETAITQLRVENSLLREQLLQAREALLGADDWTWPIKLRLTPHTIILIRLLYKHYPHICNKEMLHAAFYGGRIDDWPEIRIIDVRICQIRKKLKPNFIETIWGRGYRLTPSGKRWIDAQIRKQQRTNGKG